MTSGFGQPATRRTAGRAQPARQGLPVIETEPPRRGPDRRVDRHLTFAGLVAAGGFLAAALVSLALPAEVRLGWWLPLHLALAGAAGTAIAAMLPFFVAALAVAPPAPPWLHGGAIVLVAVGAAGAAIGRVIGPATPAPLAALGGVVFILGVVAIAAAAALPLRAAAGPRRPATELAYGLGLLNVAIGVTLATFLLAGSPDAAAGWAGLRPAHAWLNAFGFVGLVVAGTLLHFAPTVAGARIRSRRSGLVAVAGLGGGPPVVALGYAAGLDHLVRGGVVVTLIGAAALAWHGFRAQRDRAGWTTDREWHRFTAGSLLAAPAWLLVAVAVAAVRILPAGASATGWRLEDVLAPLVAGFVLQVLLGALAHLVPAIGPGGAEQRVAARRVLGRGGSLRLVAWNAGTALLAVGLAGGLGPAAAAGGAVLGTTLVATLALLGLSLRQPR